MFTLNHKAGTALPKKSPKFMLALAQIKSIALMAMLLGGVACPAQAQLQPKEVENFMHGIEFLGISGDTMTFQFLLGREDQPASHAGGFHLKFKFPKLTTTPDEILVNLAGTWLTTDISTPMPNTTYQPETRLLSIEYQREHPTQPTATGWGAIAQIQLVREGGFHTQEATMHREGGIVMVDNLNFRLQAPEETPKQPWMVSNTNREFAPIRLQACPNPAQDYVRIQVEGTEGGLLSLIDEMGRVILSQPATATQQLDLQQIPPGAYTLILEADGKVQQVKVVRQ